MKVLVTGATGFIGRHLVARLVADGHDTHALLRPMSDATRLPRSVTVHHDAGPLDALLASVRPEAALHLATRYQHGHAHGDIAPMLEANIVFGARLADAAARCGTRAFVTLGTGAQHAGDGATPATLYAASKQAFETVLCAIARSNGLATATLIVFDTFGPNDTRGKILDRMIEAARTGTSLALSPGGQAIDLVHVEDVVDAILHAARGLLDGTIASGSRFALSSSMPMTLREMADTVTEALGRPVPAQWGTLPYRPGEIMMPWRGGAPLPGWQPRRSLEEHLRSLAGGAA
ncbi:NAD-dependent epimerase/dehydratase family protein [Elioraea rosea]|uniref:NAD-dependent epimerase/dehydratase family protein n=1 Tax=Elioraea rosea TaxID=2492390 RepID=UPI001183C8C7|nr:NAD(P)-dependent oxidoreductase [Elioraea rosea]